MNDEKQETIADIVSDMYAYDSGEIADIWVHQFANRIEAAHKRESETGAEAAQICGEIGEMIGREAAGRQPVTDCNCLGNAAKMREALETISKCDTSKEEDCYTLYRVCEAALSAKPRNCDRPECATTRAAQEVWRKEDGGKTAYYEWLLATSTKGETKQAKCVGS